MSPRTLLIVFGVGTFMAFAAWRLAAVSIVGYGGIAAGLGALALLFVVGAIAAPYLDR